MLSHTVSSIDAFAAAVDGLDGPGETELFSGSDILGSNPLEVARTSVDRSQRAWSSVTDWEASLTTPLGPIPAVQAIAIVTFSTLIHSWDLAASVGESVEFNMAEAALAESVGSQIVPLTRPKGLFGPEVAIPGDASPTARILALTGRNPL